jgi:hypothetical protein
MVPEPDWFRYVSIDSFFLLYFAYFQACPVLTRIGSAAALRQGQFCLKPFYGFTGNDLEAAIDVFQE